MSRDGMIWTGGEAERVIAGVAGPNAQVFAGLRKHTLTSQERAAVEHVMIAALRARNPEGQFTGAALPHADVLVSIARELLCQPDPPPVTG